MTRPAAIAIAVLAVAAVYAWARTQRTLWSRTSAGHRCEPPPPATEPTDPPLPNTGPLPAAGMMALGGSGAVGPDVHT